MTVKELQQLLGKLEDDDVLVRNAVGNLSIIRNGSYSGFVDLLFGEVEFLQDDDQC